MILIAVFLGALVLFTLPQRGGGWRFIAIVLTFAIGMFLLLETWDGNSLNLFAGSFGVIYSVAAVGTGVWPLLDRLRGLPPDDR